MYFNVVRGQCPIIKAREFVKSQLLVDSNSLGFNYKLITLCFIQEDYANVSEVYT